MPRCPLCRSALVTITFGLYPTAVCTSCGARWIQDGSQQRLIDQVLEPSLLAPAAPRPARTTTATRTGATTRPAASRRTHPW
jgi:Zn-finger nucleic acid-binding protein